MAKVAYEVVFPDQKPYCVEVDDRLTYSKTEICREAARHRDIGFSERGEEERLVEATLQRLEIRNGELVRISVGSFKLAAPVRPLTQETINAAMDELLEDLPIEFANWVRSYAYEQGHSAGYDEVHSIARALAGDLAPVVKAYADRVMEELRQAKPTLSKSLDLSRPKG